MREFLVLLQFTISAAAIAATLMMVAQMRYVRSQPLGFERDNRLVVVLRGAATIEKIAAIRNELLADSRIRGVAVAQQEPANGDDRTPSMVLQTQNKEGAMEQQRASLMFIGADYEPVMGLTIVQAATCPRAC